MGTHPRWTEGPGWDESNVRVHLAGAQGGLEGSESDGKEVTVVGLAGTASMAPAAPASGPLSSPMETSVGGE